MAVSDRGFASMHPVLHRELSQRGGRAVHAKGRGHAWAEGSAAAKEAGRKGGQKNRDLRRAERAAVKPGGA